MQKTSKQQQNMHKRFITFPREHVCGHLELVWKQISKKEMDEFQLTCT